jgi:hypothetical protein
MDQRILYILETIPRHVLIICAEKLFLKNKKFETVEKSNIQSNTHRMDSKIFRNELIMTYEIILDLIKMNGNAGIVNKKRQETYMRAITSTKEIDSNLAPSEFTKELASNLTEKPKKIMKELFTKGQVTLEDKPPYNGAIIKDGRIVRDEEEQDELEAFKNLSVLTGIGIGLGDSGIKDLIRMGYSSIEQLKTVYEKDKFAKFRKGLQGPLCKYFEGTVRIEKMSREEATKWRDVILSIVNQSIEEEDVKDVVFKHKIAGSYARKKEEIGDIDYVIVANGTNANLALYKIMNSVLDKLTEVTDIGDLPVELDSVTETPSKAIKGKRYSTAIKLWFKVASLKTKVEIYGYANTEFVFPYFARAGEVSLQKKVKIQALKKGYKLSPWSLDIKDTDIPIETISEQIETMREKIGKDKIETIKELFDFLEYSRG